MVISFYMKGNNKSTKYELVESLAPSSKIPKADSMDGTIGDIFNKEVNDSNHSRCVNNMSYGATVGASAANSNLIEFKK